MSDTLNPGEPHPAVAIALEYFRSIPLDRLLSYKENFSSMVLSNNRTAEICLGTLNRLLRNDVVSDRYFLGLVWVLKMLEEQNAKL